MTKPVGNNKIKDTRTFREKELDALFSIDRNHRTMLDWMVNLQELLYQVIEENKELKK